MWVSSLTIAFLFCGRMLQTADLHGCRIIRQLLLRPGDRSVGMQSSGVVKTACGHAWRACWIGRGLSERENVRPMWIGKPLCSLRWISCSTTLPRANFPIRKARFYWERSPKAAACRIRTAPTVDAWSKWLPTWPLIRQQRTNREALLTRVTSRAQQVRQSCRP
jgi:hypothetical protein